jgi:hypothetical protein
MTIADFAKRGSYAFCFQRKGEMPEDSGKTREFLKSLLQLRT